MSKLIRKTFLFPKEAIQRLDVLKSNCHFNSYTDVIRLALSVLEEVLAAVKSNKTIVFRSADGTEKLYHPLYKIEEDTPVSTSENRKLAATG